MMYLFYRFIIAIVVLRPGAAYAAENLPRPSCPGDTVIWLNQNTGVYHVPGDRWYGRTKHGAYECERQAIAEGDKKSGVRGARHKSRNLRKAAPTDAPHSITAQVDDAKPADNVENPF